MSRFDDPRIQRMEDLVSHQGREIRLLEHICRDLQHQIDLIKGRAPTQFVKPDTPTWDTTARG